MDSSEELRHEVVVAAAYTGEERRDVNGGDQY